MAEIFVAKKSQFKEGDRRIVQTERGEVGVVHHEGAFFAYSNTCAHSGGPACEGVLIPKVVDIIAEDRTYQGQRFDDSEMHFVCPWHGWEYDMKTGVSIGDPRLRLKKFEVVERGGDIFVIA
jgi:nitrite reductase/ring-hydroxylating ferredoxin subunit